MALFDVRLVAIRCLLQHHNLRLPVLQLTVIPDLEHPSAHFRRAATRPAGPTFEVFRGPNFKDPEWVFGEALYSNTGEVLEKFNHSPFQVIPQLS